MSQNSLGQLTSFDFVAWYLNCANHKDSSIFLFYSITYHQLKKMTNVKMSHSPRAFSFWRFFLLSIYWKPQAGHLGRLLRSVTNAFSAALLKLFLLLWQNLKLQKYSFTNVIFLPFHIENYLSFELLQSMLSLGFVRADR